MYYLYKITNKLEGKIYIGQTNDPDYRWRQHCSYAIKDYKNKQYIHRAMGKHGVENFIFEVIAMCRTPKDTNEIEGILIEQYNSRDKTIGYNIRFGGSNSPHAEETKEKQRQATLNQIATQGHPAQGTKRTPEQSANLRRARKENPVIYTPEIRQRMSEAHIGEKHSQETILKRIESIKKTNLNKKIEKIKLGEIKCHAPGCTIDPFINKVYIIVDNKKYCSAHGQRLKKRGTFELPLRTSHNKGKTAPNRIQFTEEQTLSILQDKRPLERIAKDFEVTAKVIARVKKEGRYKTYEDIMKNGK